MPPRSPQNVFAPAVSGWLGYVLIGLLWAAGCFSSSARAFDLSQRSISKSKQFIVYSEDAGLRRQIAQFADEVKLGVLQVLGEGDFWKFPILITLQRAATDRPGEQPCALSMLQYELGYKLQLDVRIGLDPAAVNLQRHLVRALLLEFIYRNRPASLQEGKAFAEAPWWLVEGMVQALRTKDLGTDTDFYRRIIDVNRLPALDQFLEAHPEELGTETAAEVDRACAYCLLRLLIEQPLGRPGLVSYLRRLPDPAPSSLAGLRRDFPSLGSTVSDLEKWWTLNLARLSASERYKGLSPEETDSMLSAVLQLEIPGNNGAPAQSFNVEDFADYMKLKAATSVLASKHAAVVGLSSRANALYVEIVADYEEILSQLSRGKTRGMREKLHKVASAREFLLRRKVEIGDFMNWFEATQMDIASKSFDGYMKVANELEKPKKRTDPVSLYLDEVSQGLFGAPTITRAK